MEHLRIRSCRKHGKLGQFGQAMIEYLLVMSFLAIIGIKMSRGFSNFMALSIGNLGHVLSVHLTVGVCKENCFFKGFKNGFEN